MKIFFLFLIPVFLLAASRASITNNFSIGVSPNNTTKLADVAGKKGSPHQVNLKKIGEAKAYCKKQRLDTTIAFFADMSIHSGKKRFFVIDLQKKTVLHSGLCCHGMGKESRCDSVVFSNEKGSNCTSLGKYKTGLRSYSNWGINIHYKMHGLEKTNSNAFQRTVVLHSYDPVPEEEIYPDHLPMGWSQGCPVLSNNMMKSIDNLLKKRKTPVLIWIYK